MFSRSAATINHRILSKACVNSQKMIGRSMHIIHRIGNSNGTFTVKFNDKLSRFSPHLCSSFIRSISQASSPKHDSEINANSPKTGTDDTVHNVSAGFEPPNSLDPIPDAPLPPTPEVLDVASSLAEPTFASLGLGSWWPSGIIQQLLELLHVSVGLPWWASITIGTVCLRTLMLPVIIRHQKASAVAHNTLPGLQKIQNKLTEARTNGDDYDAAKYNQELMLYMKENHCSPAKLMLLPAVQAPIFISVFFGLKGMANLPVESMTQGGLYWFTDLTMTDPYYILPLLTTATLYATIRLGIDGPRLNTMGMLRYVVMAMPLVILPFTANFPAALTWYWFSSNVFTLIQASVLKIPQVRSYLNIPALAAHAKGDVRAQKPFVQGFKESWSNMKLQRELTDRQQLDSIQFNRAGRGPIPKTYTYNPMRDQLRKSQAMAGKK